MPLESLSQPFNPDEPGRKLREVQVEHEIEPSIESVAREHFERLKKLPLRDNEGRWRIAMSNMHAIGWSQEMQCLASACEAALGNTPEMDDQKMVDEILLGPQLGDEDAEVGYALLAQFWQNPELARKNFSKLMEVLTKKRNLDTGDNNDIFILYTGILLKDKHAIEIAKSWKIQETSDIRQLLNFILITIELDLSSAEEYWEEAKSEFYDKEAGLFFRRGDLEECFTQDQLKAVLIEARLEAKEAEKKFAQRREIPEERNF